MTPTPVTTMTTDELPYYGGYYWNVQAIGNDTHLLRCQGSRKCTECEFSMPMSPNIHQRTHIDTNGNSHSLRNHPCMAIQIIGPSGTTLVDPPYHSHTCPDLDPVSLFENIDPIQSAYQQGVLSSLWKIDSRGHNLGHLNSLKRKKFQYIYGHYPNSAALLLDPTFLSNLDFSCDHRSTPSNSFVSFLSHPAFDKAHDNLRSCSSMFSDTVHNVFTETNGRSYHLHCDYTYDFETSHGQTLSASLMASITELDYFEHYKLFHQKYKHFTVLKQPKEHAPSPYWYTTSSGLSYMKSQIDSHIMQNLPIESVPESFSENLESPPMDDALLPSTNIAVRANFNMNSDVAPECLFMNIKLPQVSLDHSITIGSTKYQPVCFTGFQSNAHIVGVFRFPKSRWMMCNDLSSSTFSLYTQASFECVHQNIIGLYVVENTIAKTAVGMKELPKMPWNNNSCWATQMLSLLNIMDAYGLPVCIEREDGVNGLLTTWKTVFQDGDADAILRCRDSLHNQFADSPNGMGSPFFFISSLKNTLTLPQFDISSEITCPGCKKKYSHPMGTTILPTTDNNDLHLSHSSTAIINCPTLACAYHRIPFSLLNDTIVIHNIPSSYLNKRCRKVVRDKLEVTIVPVDFLVDELELIAGSFQVDQMVEIGGVKTTILVQGEQRYLSRTYLGNVQTIHMFNNLNIVSVPMNYIPSQYLPELTKSYLPHYSTPSLKALILKNLHRTPSSSSKTGSGTSKGSESTEFIPTTQYDPEKQILSYPKYGISIAVPISLMMSDFSLAQINGHALSIAYVVQQQLTGYASHPNTRTVRNLNQHALDIAVEIVSSFFKGCGYHFKLNMVAFARTLVGIDASSIFLQRIDELRHKKLPMMKFKENINSLISDFPESAPVLSWWTRSIIGKMAFASLSDLKVPFHKSENTNNPIESGFHLLRLLGLRKKTLGEGLVILSLGYNFAESQMENPHISRQYGERANKLLPDDLLIPKHKPKKKIARSLIIDSVDEIPSASTGVPNMETSSIRKKRFRHHEVTTQATQRKRSYCRCSKTSPKGICLMNNCSCRRKGVLCGNLCHCAKHTFSCSNSSHDVFGDVSFDFESSESFSDFE